MTTPLPIPPAGPVFAGIHDPEWATTKSIAAQLRLQHDRYFAPLGQGIDFHPLWKFIGALETKVAAHGVTRLRHLQQYAVAYAEGRLDVGRFVDYIYGALDGASLTLSRQDTHNRLALWAANLADHRRQLAALS